MTRKPEVGNPLARLQAAILRPFPITAVKWVAGQVSLTGAVCPQQSTFPETRISSITGKSWTTGDFYAKVSLNMALFRCRHSVAELSVRTFIALSMASIPAFPQIPSPQTQSSGSEIPPRHDSVEVVEHLSPEEVEDGKLNDVYQSVVQLQPKGTCTQDIIQRYESDVITRAEKSAFNVPRNKFLFLAHRDIGNCYLAQRKFAEAEASFQKILQYAPVWPGTNDSAYPINFRQIATAQMGQQHWASAEQSLLKSIALFESQTAAAEKSDTELHSAFTLNYRGSQSRSYALLAVVYFREGLTQDALNTVEKAYDEVTKYNLAPQYRNEVVNIGKSIANASGKSAAQKVWSQRDPAK